MTDMDPLSPQDLVRRHLTASPFGSPLELQQILAMIPRLSANALHARSAVLRLADNEHDGQRFVFVVEGADDFSAVEPLLSAMTRREMVPVLVPDLRSEPQLAGAAPARPAAAVAAPLLQHGSFLGTLCLFDRERGVGFDEEDVTLLATLATEAGIAIENARLFREAAARAAELGALREVGEAITGRLELPAVLEAIVAGAMRLLRSQYTQILLWDAPQERLVYGAALGPEADRVRSYAYSAERGINVAVARTRRSMVLDDYQASPYALPEFPDVVATITTPVLFGNRLLGVLHSHTTQPGKRFTGDDLHLLEMLATQAAIAIENARLYAEAGIRAARLRALGELSRTIAAALDLRQVFDFAVKAAVDLLDLAVARLWLLQETTGLLTVQVSAGDPDLLASPRQSIAPGEGITGRVFSRQEIAVLVDAAREPGFAEREWAAQVGLQTVAMVPVCVGERALAVLSVGRRSRRAFHPDELEVLTSFAQHVAIAIENARLFRDRERLATEELLRLRKISVLNEIGSAMQGTMQLDALLRVILTGVTYGGGLGFNRALLLLVDEARQVLRGRMGVGPASGEEAAVIWDDLTRQSRPLREIVAERAANPLPANALFDQLARSFRIPLADGTSLFVRTVREARPFRVRRGGDVPVHPAHEGRLDVDEFACVPLSAKGKVVGVLVVDNKFNGIPIGDEDLEFLSVFATHAGLAIENAQVLTWLEQANRDLQRSHHQLLQQERLAALGEMAAHVVHEIRNPLVAIGGFARRLVQRLGPREPEGQYAQIIAREVDRLERIARDVRGLSRESHLTLEDSDLHLILQDCLVLFAEKLASQGVHLRLDLMEPLPTLRLDRGQVKQAIVNLVANALEAMPRGGTLSLASTERRGEPGRSGSSEPLRPDTPQPLWVVLSVGDTGGGIPADIASAVFDAFYTTKETGTGLGLTLVRRIALAHGGQIELDNRPGEGATFRLWFPVTESRVATAS